jgi:hypothetical protein
MQAQARAEREGFPMELVNEALVALVDDCTDASNRDAKALFAWATLSMGK